MLLFLLPFFFFRIEDDMKKPLNQSLIIVRVISNSGYHFKLKCRDIYLVLAITLLDFLSTWDEKPWSCLDLVFFRGRGIWRCLYDPKFLLLITAGFDSSIKVHQLGNKSLSSSLNGHSESKDNDTTRIYMIRTPSSSDHIRLTDR